MELMSLIVLTCPKRLLESLVDEITDYLAVDQQASVVLYGLTRKEKNGFILLGWHTNHLPGEFLRKLQTDEDVYDFAVFDPPYRWTLSDAASTIERKEPHEHDEHDA
jgi:hypothetical protein